MPSRAKNIEFWCRFDNPFPEMYLLLSRNSFPTRISRSFLLSLFLFIYESHYVAFRVMLRETSSGMVFFLSFYLFYSILLTSLSLALFLYLPSGFHDRFLLTIETRRLVCRSGAWECLRLQQGGRPANSTPIKYGGSVCTRLFYYFPFPCRALATMNRVVTNYVMHKRINISGQEIFR